MQIILPNDLGSRTLRRWVEAAGRLDRAGHLMLLLEGSAEDPLDALAMAAFCSTSTRHIGLCATVDTRIVEPFTFARGLATLDHLSKGRAAWRCVGDNDAARIGEFAEVVARLLTSWGPGALVERHADGILSDADAVHSIDHAGAHFFSRGPLNMPQPPQGVPPLIALYSDTVRPRGALVLQELQLVRCSSYEVGQLPPPQAIPPGLTLRDRLAAA